MEALCDFSSVITRWSLISLLAWQEFKHRYRRSLFGPFWSTLSTAIFVAAISLVLGSALNVPISEYAPYVAIGIVLWQFLSSAVSNSCASFVTAAPLIKDMPLPIILFPAKDLYRELIALIHNSIIIPIAFIFVGRWFEWSGLWALLGFAVLLANLGWVTLLLSLVSVRYRDVQQIVSSILPIVMIASPIMWIPSMMPNRLGIAFLELNPVARLIELVREPLLGNFPSLESWIFGIVCALVGWIVATAVYVSVRKQVAFWI